MGRCKCPGDDSCHNHQSHQPYEPGRSKIGCSGTAPDAVGEFSRCGPCRGALVRGAARWGSSSSSAAPAVVAYSEPEHEQQQQAPESEQAGQEPSDHEDSDSLSESSSDGSVLSIDDIGDFDFVRAPGPGNVHFEKGRYRKHEELLPPEFVGASDEVQRKCGFLDTPLFRSWTFRSAA